MKRISGHEIDIEYVAECSPIPLNIAVYIDGYGAKKSADVLYDLGDQELYEHLRREAKGDMELHKQLFDTLHFSPSPEIYAELVSFSLALVELHVVAAMEDRFRARGLNVRPNALLVNQSNPIEVQLNDKRHNVLEALYPASNGDREAEHYLDVSCEGTIYSTGKIDREKQIAALKRELETARRHRDSSRIAWIERNLETLPGGIFHYRNNDGSIGGPVDFNFSERFYDEVSDRVGYYSRLGESKVHWKQDLGDFGEKGVDCDLIMQVMDDLQSDRVDAFVFMTNDMDFFPLIERIRASGKAVFLCGLEGRVSYRLIRSAGRQAFINLASPQMITCLPSVFMAAKNHVAREQVLQWTYLAMMRLR